jgi:cytochrome c oxidase assembly factor CtaG
MLIAALLYCGGLWRLILRRDSRATFHGSYGIRAAAFAAGWIFLGIALLSPMDTLGGKLFWVHMVQHEVLMLLAAPFLVLGRPLPLFLWALPARARTGVGAVIHARAVQSTWRWLTQPVAGWSTHAAALWLWHAPLLFDAALRDPLIHDLQHLSFLLTALLFWSALLTARTRSGNAAGILYLFTTAVHSSVLGALITLATRPWYPGYAATAPTLGWHALEDQQVGGLIMWVPGSMVYVAFALILLWRWLRADQPSSAGLRHHQIEQDQKGDERPRSQHHPDPQVAPVQGG